MPQTSYKSRATAGRPGMPYDNTGQVVSVLNKDPQAKQIDTVTIDTATDDEDYGVLIDGVDISIDSGSGATTSGIASDLVDAINAKKFVNSRVVAELSGSDVVITARHGGVGFTTQEGDNAGKMTLVNTQANATADPVKFGRLVMSDGWVSDTLAGEPRSGTERKGKLVKGTNFTAQVDELELTYDAGVSALVSIRYYDPTIGEWVQRDFEHTMASDADTSVIALVGLINGQMPSDTVIASHPTGDTITLTAEVPGVAFEVTYGFGTGASTAAWTHTTNRGPDTDVNMATLGIAQISQLVERSSPTVPGTLGDGITEYPANRAMSVREDGRVWTEPEAAASASDKVYVRLESSGSLDELGGFSPTPGAGLVRLKKANWHTVDGDLAVIQLDAA